MTVKSPLRILLLEDNSEDAELIRELLEADLGVCEMTRVQTRAEFVAALENGDIDLILADYQLPSFDGLSALKLALSARPDLPFIFVSGTLGEEVAIEALKIGALDYVLKTGLSKLVPSVRRALREAGERAERTNAERALRRSEAYLAEAQRLNRTGSFGWDVLSGEIFWSDETYRIFECEPTRKPTLDLVINRAHRDDRTLVRQIIASASIERSGFAAEFRLMMPDGAVKYVQVVTHRAAGESPESLGLVGAVTDITERKRAEEAVRRSETELRHVIEAIPTLAFSTLPDGTNVWVNQRWVQYTGLSAEETTGPGWQSTIHPDDFDGHVTKWQQSLASGEPFENEARHRSAKGEYRWFLVRAVPLHDEQGKIFKWYGIVTDIEDRKRAEEALRESQQRFRDYAEIASDWFWESGPDHRFTRFSQSAARWGFGGERLGLRRWDLAADCGEEPEKWRAHISMLEAHQPFRGFRYRTSLPDASAIYLSASGKPVYDANGNFRGYRGVASDISTEVRAEEAERALRQAQAELAHVTRVTTLGELATSIAHEINQPLAAIVTEASAALRWLNQQVPNLPESRQALDAIIKAANHTADLTTRIRALAKKSPIQKQPLDINDVIIEVVTLTRAELNLNRVELRTQLADDLPLVQADRIELQQVVLNLIINAIEAMSDGDERDLLIASTKHDTNNVRVLVGDSGQGLDPATADRMFQAFYTTKPGGMGMGLSICRSIIERLGGHLSARANAPRGTILEFSIPIE